MTTLHVIIGPPCSGKTTYVGSRRAPEDVVVDMDALAHALGGQGVHAAHGGHRTAALTCRTAILDRVLSGRWESKGDVWLIHHHPPQAALDRYRRAGAELHLLDPGVDVCLARARADGRPRWTTAAITEWYADPIDLGITVGNAGSSRAW